METAAGMTKDTQTSMQSLMQRWAEMRPRVVGSLRARGFAEHDAEDIYQQAIVRAVDAHPSLRRAGAAESWFWTLVHRRATDFARSQSVAVRRHEEVALDTLAVAEEDGAEETCACSLRMIEDLPEGYAGLLRAVDLNGEAVSEAASSFGISANNASVRLHRARRALRARLHEVCGTTSVAACLTCGCEG
jgi:RNA polymerase sigma factor (sigma-70 family)